MPNTPLKGDYNTYIGARYVPIIGGMWNQQTEYEPLTIVMYQGSSYTSKTFVPKGTQIDNTTYWVRTANYDEQVEFYRQEVQQYKKDIDASEAEYIATVQKAQEEFTESITNRQVKYENDTTKTLTAIANSAIAPIFVDNVSDMSDSTKVYVLKTNKHIYAYISGAFTDTGLVYGDPSLFVQSANKNINDDDITSAPYDDLNTYPSNRIYCIATSSLPKNSPNIADSAPYSSPYRANLISFDGAASGPSTVQIFTIWDYLDKYKDVYIRFAFGSEWSAWIQVAKESEINDINSALNLTVKSDYRNINNDDITSAPYDDLNTYPSNRIYCITTSSLPKNSPNIADSAPYSSPYRANLISFDGSASGPSAVQIFTIWDYLDKYKDVYIRFVFGSEWSAWIQVAKESEINDIKSQINNSSIKYNSEINDIKSQINNLSIKYNLTTYIDRTLKIKNTDTFTILGDSISGGWSANLVNGKIEQSDAITPVIPKLMNLLGVTSYDNRSIGGWGYSESTRNMLIQAKKSEIKTTYLMIMAGTNDYSSNFDKTTFKNALTELSSYLKENYTGTVIIVTPINRSDEIVRNIPLDWYRDCITEWAIINGYYVIAGNELGFPKKDSTWKEELSGDGIHPSNIGHVFYAHSLNQYIHN